MGLDVEAATYREMQRLARHFLGGERREHTLRATELVHEAWLRLAGRADLADADRAAFLRAAGTSMRRVLVDHARARVALRRSRQRAVPLEQALAEDRADVEQAELERDERLAALDEALAALERRDPALARLVELRWFVGLTARESAEALGISLRSAHRSWRLARAWLLARLDAELEEPPR